MGRLSRGVALAVSAAGALLACANLDGLAGDAATDGGVKGAGGAVATVEGGAPVSLGGVSVTPGSVALEGAACGVRQTADITLKSASDTATPYTFVLPVGGTFALEGADTNGAVSGVVPAHGAALVHVNATSASPGTETADIQATIGGSVTTLSVSLATRGATLAFSPATLDFGEVRQNTASAAANVNLRNDGDDSVTVQSFSGAPDFVTPTALVVPAHGTIAAPITFTAGAAGLPLNERATPLITGGTLCGATPSLQLEGQRVNTSVTVNPATIDFGQVGCETDPSSYATKPLTISNYSSLGSVPFTLSLASGSHFALAHPPASVPAATSVAPGTVAIPIGIASLPPGPGRVTDTITVTFTAAGSSSPTTAKVAVSMLIIGAVITVTTSSPVVTAHSRQITAVPIVNTGNVTACVEYVSSSAQFALESDKGDTVAVGDEAQTVDFEYLGTASTTGNVAISVNTGVCPGATVSVPICGALPAFQVVGAP